MLFINRYIGTLDNCMHPSILSDTIEELIFNTKNPHQYNSKVIIDEEFLNQKNISLNKYKMGKNVKKLDDLFMLMQVYLNFVRVHVNIINIKIIV